MKNQGVTKNLSKTKWGLSRYVGLMLTLAMLVTAIVPFGVFADGEDAVFDDSGIEAVQIDGQQEQDEAIEEDEAKATEETNQEANFGNGGGFTSSPNR
ncbi:MAG: hypothetical protein LBN34_06805 [Clostridiales Family XIII bacterium]|nr:hypothetical protein [Clostridiales Family XIII bacterium]